MFFYSKKLKRFLLIFLLLLLVFPLLHYYALRFLQPEMVVFREPRGRAIKVMSGSQQSGKSYILTSFLSYLHDFYQNGL
ncbi:MAG: YqzK family protein [Firmicutes bacterium]|nr:YqzK family protein [Bacillota bacterium]